MRCRSKYRDFSIVLSGPYVDFSTAIRTLSACTRPPFSFRKYHAEWIIGFALGLRNP
jgi:hypothetical protein